MTIGPRNSKPMVALVVTLLCLSSFLPLVPAASAAGGGQYPTSILSVDGHGVSAGGCNPGAGGTCSIPITTSEPYDVIVFFTQCNTGVPVGSATPSDTGSLTWSARYAFAAVGGRNQGEYWAYAPGPLSSDTLTVTFSAAQSNCRIHWFGISGANTASPFDTNGAEPAVVNANSPASCTMTTTGSNDILFGEVGQGGTGYTSSPTGWTLLDVTGYGFQSALSYEIVSAKVTAQAETWTFIAGSNVSGLCDAIQQASDGLGYTVVTAATSGSSTVINPVIKNDWLVVVVGLEGIGQHVSSVTDTASSTFSKVGSSATDDDIETWCGRYTASTGGDVVTVTASSSASFSFRVVDVSSVTSCTADSVVAAHGNALDPVIPSTTLTAGDVCFASISYQSGTAGISWELNSPAGQPWVTYLGGNGVTTRPDSVDTSGNYYVADTEKAGWASGTSTTAQFTSSGASAVGWDELVVCLPTNPLSAGAQGQRGTSDASSASQSFQWYNPTTGGEYVLAEIAIPGTSVTVSGISSASPSVAWTKIGSSDTREDVEIWGALLTGGYQTFTATASLSGAAVMEANVIVVDNLAGTANVWTTKTASGTSASASVTSFTPTTNDFCVQATNFNAGATTAATTGSSPFQSAYPVQQSGSATR
ncbi:MAG: hypothetical protein ABSA72_07740, partial [Nitrososphaerales archaeon]